MGETPRWAMSCVFFPIMGKGALNPKPYEPYKLKTPYKP